MGCKYGRCFPQSESASVHDKRQRDERVTSVDFDFVHDRRQGKLLQVRTAAQRTYMRTIMTPDIGFYF